MTNDSGSDASRASSFRMHAQEAEDFASQAVDEGVCEAYRKLASGWHNLADETEVPNFLLNQYRMEEDSDPIKVYRLRAEALRTIAEATAPDSSRQILVHIAEDYERKAHAREVVSRWDLRPKARNSS